MSRRARRIAVVVVTLVLVCAAAASAYYTAHGSGHANAGVGTLSAPSIASATPGAGTVALSWSAVTPPASGSVTYYVRRDGGAASAACPSQAAPTGVTSCTDTGVPVGTHTYTVTAVWRTWTAASAAANATVASGPVASLVVSTQPGGTITGGTAFPTQPVVTAKDASNNTVLNYSGTVALAITSGTGATGAALSGCNGTLANGVTTFSGCKVDKSGTNYRLTASDGTRTVDTNQFNITVGPLAQLAFTQQPSGAVAGTAFTTQPKVTQQDAGGNTVTTGGSAATLTIASGTGTAGAVLSTCSGAFSNGVTTFSGCKLDKSGSGYQLHATDGTRTTDSAAFAVSPGAMASLAFTTQPSNGTGGIAFPTQPVVTAFDSQGNVATGYAGTVTLTLRNGGTGSALSGCSGSPLNGVTTFTGCKVNLADTGYKLRAKDGSPQVDSNAFDITTGPLAALSVSTDSTPTAGTGTDVVVTAVDAGGNTVTSYTGSHSITFGGASAGPVSGTLPTVVNSTGSAINFGSATALSFANGISSTTGSSGTITLRKAETTSITATDGTLTSGAGFAVAVLPGAGAKIAFTGVSVSAGTLGACFYTCSVTAIGTPGGTFSAHISITDVDGNIASGLGGPNKTVAVARTAGTGTFVPSGTSVNVTVPSSGTATSSSTFTFQTPTSGTWATNTLSATNASYTPAGATLSR
jgi:trimeric autotransporter adhesin